MTRMAFVTLITSILAGCASDGAAKSEQAPTQAQQTAATADPLVAACEAGTVQSCMRAASSAESAGDQAEAARLYGLACELGDAGGCAFWGAALAQDPQTLAQAAAAFEKGCELGDGASCYGAGLTWSGAFGGVEDPVRATAAFKAGCEAGLAESCGVYANTVEGTDPAAAKQLRESACTGGDGASCIMLARKLLEEGDRAGANTFLETACTHDGRGCTQQGLLAIDEDPVAARGHFQKGCVSEIPDPDACGWYGWFAYSGTGGARAEDEGAAVLQAACEADGALACMFEGVVMQKKGEAGAARLERACELAPTQCEAMRLQYQALTASN